MLVPSAFSQAVAAFVAQNIGAGFNRGFLCKNSGCAFDEPDCGSESVLYWSWNTGIYGSTDYFVCWIHAVSGKGGIECQKDERYLENFILK